MRALRDLGVDLASVRRVLEREVSLADVAAVHAAALDAGIERPPGSRRTQQRLQTGIDQATHLFVDWQQTQPTAEGP